MNEDTYRVSLEKVVQARNCTIEAAIILAKAFFEKYYAEKGVSVTITREVKTDEE